MKQVIYFSASWCMPCKVLKPKMQKLAESVNVRFVDVDAESDFTSKYNIRSVPTVVIVENLNEITRYVGNNINPETIKEVIKG
jgi:thioredoxin 1